MDLFTIIHTVTYTFNQTLQQHFMFPLFDIAENFPKEWCIDLICCDPAGPSHRSTRKRSASCEAQFTEFNKGTTIFKTF